MQPTQERKKDGRDENQLLLKRAQTTYDDDAAEAGGKSEEHIRESRAGGQM